MSMDFKHFYSNSTSYNIYVRRHTHVCSDHTLSPILQTQFVPFEMSILVF
jgi:hypothetical protein